MSAERPTVSIITANYNGARHLAAAVRSVLKQSLRDFEMIIVDDCSTDDSLAVIAEAAGGDPRIRVIVQDQNGGPAKARNRAIDEARGRWIAVFDSDDLMAPDRLARLVARGQADRADIVADNLMIFVDGCNSPWKPYLPAKSCVQARWITLADYIASAKMYAKAPGLGYLKPMFRAEVLRDAGMRYREDLRIGEDYDLVLRLLAQGLTMRLEPMPLYRYRKHATSISHALRREHIEQMLAADAELESALRAHPKTVWAAQTARRKSLETALTYDKVISELKAKQLARACLDSATHPDVWPLLSMPVMARVKRLAARFSIADDGAYA